MERNFQQLLEAKWNENKFICVGLDSNYSQIPESARKDGIANTIVAFNKAIVEATKDLVCAYKPNVAFYEAHGDEGLAALHRTIVDIHIIAADVPVILDAKRADIGNTNAGYVEAAFGFLRTDAITVHPYLGAEALQPFLARTDKGIFVLCRTSNPGAGEFQDLLVNGEPLYRFVARRVASEWNKGGNCAVVVGATYPQELREVREIIDDMPILIPAIGAQSTTGNIAKDVEEAVRNGMNSKKKGIILNAARSIIFASEDKDFAEAARRETLKLTELIQSRQ